MKIISYRTTMPFDNRGPNGNPVLSPTTDRSVMPFNNVPTISDILDGRKSIRDIYPNTRGNWAPGEDVDKSYKEKGDDYKREERDLDILSQLLDKGERYPEQWKVKIGRGGKGGSIVFPSFALAQKYIREHNIPTLYLARVAQKQKESNGFSRAKVISNSINKCFMVEAINSQEGVQETGSAFCVKKNYFITCAHVIKHYNKNKQLDATGFDSNIFVNLVQNGSWYRAEVVNVNLEWDIALIKCDVDVEPFELDTSFELGEDIVAIGSPHGYENNVSAGTVGSVNRKIFSYPEAPEYLFVDLAVFPGSSGGPVIKEENGKVVGMVTMIISDEGGYGLNASLSSSYIEKFCIDNIEGFLASN